jgi:hypothetical protein
MPVVKRDGALVLALIRGDDRLDEMKMLAALGSDFRPATDEEIRAAFGADPGSIGPIGFHGEVIADETLGEGQYVAGANRTGFHLRGVEAGRDYQPRFADLRAAKEDDTCPGCGGRLHFQTAIEIGHIFKLDTVYSAPLEATFLDEDGTEKPLVMGSYGIGPGRVMAAIVEQSHDEQGIVWPRSVAPYDVHVVALPGVEEQALEAATVLDAAGLSVLLDDRDARAGEKFADADLIRSADQNHGRQEDGRGRRRGRTRPGDGRGAPGGDRIPRRSVLVARRKRRFSEEPFGPTVEKLMDETGVTYRALADKTKLSAGYLNHLVHGNRPVPSDDVMRTLAKALGVEPEHFREYRLRVITERLEAMPDLIDRLYKRLRK